MFPIRDVRGEVIAFGGRVLDGGEPKYLNSPETPIFVKGRELYGLFEARQGLRDKGYALVTEGYMDVVALAQLGFPNAVATLGTACTAEHVHKLLRFTERVVFSFDGDAAGRRAAGRALEAALPHATDTRSFRFLFLPVEHDPDSYIREYGAAAFEQYVQKALPLSQQLIEVAQADCDMATAEGRARMLAQARPLWAALPEGALQRQLLAELAQKGHLTADDLASLWLGGGPRGRGGNPASSDTRADGYAGGHAGGSEGGGAGGGKPAWRKRPFGAGRGPGGGGEAPRTPRTAPKSPEDVVLQMLFGHPHWWAELSTEDHELLHGLPPPHGPLVAWLERDIAEHGPRPWAVLRHALRADDTLDDAARAHADGDADPEAVFHAFRRAVDVLLLRALESRREGLIVRAATDPEAMRHWGELDSYWKLVKTRMAEAPPEAD